MVRCLDDFGAENFRQCEACLLREEDGCHCVYTDCWLDQNVGAVVGLVLLISAVVACCRCLRRKRARSAANATNDNTVNVSVVADATSTTSAATNDDVSSGCGGNHDESSSMRLFCCCNNEDDNDEEGTRSGSTVPYGVLVEASDETRPSTGSSESSRTGNAGNQVAQGSNNSSNNPFPLLWNFERPLSPGFPGGPDALAYQPWQQQQWLQLQQMQHQQQQHLPQHWPQSLNQYMMMQNGGFTHPVFTGNAISQPAFQQSSTALVEETLSKAAAGAKSAMPLSPSPPTNAVQTTGDDMVDSGAGPFPTPPRSIAALSLAEALGNPESEKDVNRFLIQSIRLSEVDKDKIGRVTEELHTCLTKHSTAVGVSRVVKSGSLAKGTATSGGLDLDLVVFARSIVLGGNGGVASGNGSCSVASSTSAADDTQGRSLAESTANVATHHSNAAIPGLSNVPLNTDHSVIRIDSKESFRRYRDLFMKQLMWDFQECTRCVRSYRRECVFRPPFSFFTCIEGIPVDILGAFDLIANCQTTRLEEEEEDRRRKRSSSAGASHLDWDQVVQSLHGSEFNTSLVELQKKFVKSRIGESDRLKDLILLVKFWFKQVVVPQAANCRVPSYFFELVAIHHWEKKLKRKTGFKLMPALRGVLTALTRPESMYIFWTEYYSREHVDRSLVEFPLVVDPANPTNNVAKFAAPHTWHYLKRAAQEALSENVFRIV